MTYKLTTSAGETTPTWSIEYDSNSSIEREQTWHNSEANNTSSFDFERVRLYKEGQESIHEWT